MIDCHSHLSFLKKDSAESIIQKGSSQKLNQWIMGGYNFNDWQSQRKLKEIYPDSIHTCFGLHPWEVIRTEDYFDELDQLEKWLNDADFVGETGLDLFKDPKKETLQRQIEVFERHLSFNTDKAYVFHIVQAHGKALEVLEKYNVKGFVHSFSGSYEIGKRYIDQGIRLSFGPGVLSKKFIKARECLKKIPLDSILIESDAPGSRDDLSDPVKTFFDVAEEVAKIKEIEVNPLLEKVYDNFKALVE